MPFFHKRVNQTKYISFNSHNCRACWNCVDACEQGVIGKVSVFNHKHAVIREPEKCTGCRKCVKTCEYNAFTPIKTGANHD